MYVLPRFGDQCHVIRQYEEGMLVSERKLPSSQNIFLYYWLWFYHHNVELLRFARGAERTLVLGGHPICFFGMSIWKLFRNLSYVYWIGDYFPGKGLVIRMFERIKRFYHDRVLFACYLTDPINLRLNCGKLVNEPLRRTLMWGMKRYPSKECPASISKQLLFVGLLRKGQGVENAIDFVAENEGYTLALVGVAANGYDADIREMISARHLENRVYFPNRFHSQTELLEIANRSFAGFALYSLVEDNFTHYADPGKVRAYLEMNVPVIMTRISAVVPFVERFHAGEVVDSLGEIRQTIERIAANYASYQEGVLRFNDFFEYSHLYAEAFAPLEALWKN